ncbi:hypothetical protein [Micromonospora sp. NPDC005087]|uniref:hypothetical protein n=1 Tax=Micromonospora sp. NPDC005087 TaxID=3364225 RepID=UPI0036D136D2
MTRAYHFAAAVALVTVLAGCDGGAEDPVTTSATLGPTSAAPASSTPTASPSASPSQDDMLAVGKTFTFKNNTMTTTVLRYKQPLSEDGSDDMRKKGEAFGGLEVNTCNLASATEPQQVGVGAWSLEWSDGTTTNHKWSNVVSAEYPFNSKTLKPGRCVKGWIVFTVPLKSKPSVAVYEGGANQGQPAEWKLS